MAHDQWLKNRYHYLITVVLTIMIVGMYFLIILITSSNPFDGESPAKRTSQ